MNERGSMKVYNTAGTKNKTNGTVPRWYRSWIQQRVNDDIIMMNKFNIKQELS